MKSADVRQWRFRTSGTQVRAGSPVILRNDACDFDLTGPADGAVTLHRPGSSPRPVCGGEQVAVAVPGLGFLAAGASSDAGVVAGDVPATEWVVSGVPPGVAVPVDRPVALYDTVQGDHLVCVDRPEGPTLAWASADEVDEGATAAVATSRGRLLPIPPQFRPPDGVPGEAELSGALVPVRDGDLAAGLLVLLDPTDARALGRHLARRTPRLAEALAPDGAVAAIACRWSAAGVPADADPPVPPAGARLWVQGVLVADPGASLVPIRALAWALDAEGEAVPAAPGDSGWPPTVVTWRVLLPPRSGGDVAGRQGTTFYLPLPGRDGEPGSTTTVVPAPCPAGEGSRGGGQSASTALVPGPAGGPRVLRFGVPAGPSGEAVALGCTVRVHLLDR